MNWARENALRAVSKARSAAAWWLVCRGGETGTSVLLKLFGGDFALLESIFFDDLRAARTTSLLLALVTRTFGSFASLNRDDRLIPADFVALLADVAPVDLDLTAFCTGAFSAVVRLTMGAGRADLPIDLPVFGEEVSCETEREEDLLKFLMTASLMRNSLFSMGSPLDGPTRVAAA